jgi:uncharacterized delta-60 repeat protein
MVLQSDGKLVLVGQAAYGSGAQQFIAERLTATGALDSSYGRNGVVKVPVGSTALGFGIALQPDGKTILTGPAFTTKGVAAAVRLNTNGSLDQTFGTGGIATVPDWYGVNGVVLDGQGRIVMPTVGAGAVRLNQNGSADLTFGNGGVALAPLGAKGGANGAAIDPTTGNVVLAGAATINGVTELTAIRMLGSSDATVALRADVRKPATGKRRASTAAVHHGHHRRHRNRRHHRAHKHRRAAHGLSRSVLRRSAHAAVR